MQDITTTLTFVKINRAGQLFKLCTQKLETELLNTQSEHQDIRIANAPLHHLFKYLIRAWVKVKIPRDSEVILFSTVNGEIGIGIVEMDDYNLCFDEQLSVRYGNNKTIQFNLLDSWQPVNLNNKEGSSCSWDELVNKYTPVCPLPELLTSIK